MISHRYKCIFIHISKCAGTSVENAFGVDIENHNAEENTFLFGWDSHYKLWLQHATPQQLIDLNLISREEWDSYYKFIIYRNSWSRTYSDFLWMKEVRQINDSFSNYIHKTGKFTKILNESDSKGYAGDHHYLQKEYFFLDGRRIRYDREINFDNLKEGLLGVSKDLDLKPSFFLKKKLNQSKGSKKHYSFFYDRKKNNLVCEKYKKDISFFGFTYVEKKNLLRKIWSELKAVQFLNRSTF